MIKDGQLLEYEHVFGNLYGTPTIEINRIQEKGKICVLILDVKGAGTVHCRAIPANYLALYPPSYEEQRRRLILRYSPLLFIPYYSGSETADSLETRLRNTKTEIEQIKALRFVYHTLVSDDKSTFLQEAFTLIGKMYELSMKCDL